MLLVSIRTQKMGCNHGAKTAQELGAEGTKESADEILPQGTLS